MIYFGYILIIIIIIIIIYIYIYIYMFIYIYIYVYIYIYIYIYPWPVTNINCWEECATMLDYFWNCSSLRITRASFFFKKLLICGNSWDLHTLWFGALNNFESLIVLNTHLYLRLTCVNINILVSFQNVS